MFLLSHVQWYCQYTVYRTEHSGFGSVVLTRRRRWWSSWRTRWYTDRRWPEELLALPSCPAADLQTTRGIVTTLTVCGDRSRTRKPGPECKGLWVEEWETHVTAEQTWSVKTCQIQRRKLQDSIIIDPYRSVTSRPAHPWWRRRWRCRGRSSAGCCRDSSCTWSPEAGSAPGTLSDL